MKPSIGRVVHVTTDPAQNNGADIAPAMITRVWSDTCINVHVLPDSGQSYVKTSITLHDTREEAEAAGGAHRAFWPPRVEHQPGDRPPRY